MILHARDAYCFSSVGRTTLSKLHLHFITLQGRGTCRVVQKMLQSRGGGRRKLAYCRNTIMIKLLSAAKLHWGNQSVDSNYPARAVLMVELSTCYYTRKMVFKTQPMKENRSKNSSLSTKNFTSSSLQILGHM